MTDVLARFNSGKLWEFKGGIHPPEMKSQSNQTPISTALLVDKYYIPVKQHSGNAGNILVKIGDSVLKGQPLTQGGNLRDLPVHSPTSGVITNILPYVAAHPSGLAELSIEITADYRDQWCERHPIEDFLTQTPEQLIEKIYAAGIAGLGGAVFPTAAKIQSADKQVKLLIINGAECEPYISCDDRLMQDYAAEIIEGTRILRYILRPEKVVIAVEDNKPQAIEALQQALQGANDIEIRVIPTKYPSGAARQLIQILTGMEVPSGQRSSSIGVLMQNVGTVFAIKRAVINDEPLIERVITLTGDKIPLKGNQWVRLGTPIIQLLQQVEYQYDSRFPVFMGGPMMGFILPNLNAPVTKLTNCLLAPDHFEYAPPMAEQSCIRCSACSDACPVNLMPQQLYWFSRSEDHEKAQQYAIKDCIECGICAYVCPSHIPLIQYFRQEKAKIWELQEKAKKSEEAKIRFEARQARLEKEELERKARSQRAAENRREELAKQQGVDPVQAALERLKAKKSETQDSVQIKEIKTKVDEKGKIIPDNTDIMAQRQARRAAKQAQLPNKSDSIINQNITEHATEHITEASAVDFNPEKDNQKPTALDDKKSAVAAAIARAKAKKAAQQQGSEPVVNQLTAENIPHVDNNHKAAASPADSVNENVDAKKAAVAAAIARAKAKKAAQQQGSEPVGNQLTAENMPHVDNNHEAAVSPADSVNENVDAKKAAVAAAIARAKAKKAAQQQGSEPVVNQLITENMPHADNNHEAAASPADSVNENVDAKKAAVAAAIARAKAKKAAQQQANQQAE